MVYLEVVFNIQPFKSYAEIVTARLSEIGFESFVEEGNYLKAYVPENEFHKNEVDEAIAFEEDEQVQISYTYEVIPDQNWNAEWEKNFPPVEVNHFCRIRAPFHDEDSSFEHEIIIEPKMSFGTGHHATTYLMIESIEDLDLNDKSLLDMGCGTGVLAILAEKRGAKTILAIDIEDWAFENTKKNIERNNCQNIVAKKGGAELLPKKEFDVVFANINRNILLKDFPSYEKSMKADSTILLSGFFESDVPLLKEKAQSLGLSFSFQKKKEDWCLLAFKKPA